MNARLILLIIIASVISISQLALATTEKSKSYKYHEYPLSVEITSSYVTEKFLNARMDVIKERLNAMDEALRLQKKVTDRLYVSVTTYNEKMAQLAAENATFDNRISKLESSGMIWGGVLAFLFILAQVVLIFKVKYGNPSKMKKGDNIISP